MVVNQSHSAFGSGWNLAGLQEIYLNDRETALLVDGNGSELIFGNVNGEYQSPNEDFSTLEYIDETDFRGFRRTLKDKTVYEFAEVSVATPGGEQDIRYLLSSVEDRNSNRITYQYNKRGIIDLIQFPLGREVDFVIDENGSISEIITPGDRTTVLSHNSEGQLEEVQDPDGSVRNWTYSPNNLIETETTKLGATYTYSYEQDGRADTINRSGGSLETSEWTVKPNLTYGLRQNPGADVTDPGNAPIAYQVAEIIYTSPSFNDSQLDGINTYQYELSEDGQLESLSDEVGLVTERQNNSINPLGDREVDAEGNGVVYTYDDRGNVESIEYVGFQAVGQQQLTYDTEFNQLTSFIDEEGNITSYELDDRGNVIEQRQGFGTPEELVLTYTYNLQGQVATITDELDRTTSYTYNNFGLLEEILFPDGSTNRFDYDSAGNRTAFTDENGNTINYAYDELNRLETITNPEIDGVNGETIHEYDPAGNRISTTDANGNVTEFVYDMYGRLEREIAHLDEVVQGQEVDYIISYTYDAADNLITLEDGRNNSTTYTYDVRNRLKTETDPLSKITSYEYYDDNQLQQVTDRLGYTTSYEYDFRNRLIVETDALGQDTVYSYNAVSNLTDLTDRNGNTTLYRYDALNRQVEVEDAEDGIFTTVYDPKVGNISLTRDAEGNETSYTYDDRDRVATITDAEDGVTRFDYDPAGNLLTLTNEESNEIDYTYDALNRQTQIIDPQEGTTSMSYDLAGNLIEVEDALGNTTTTSYDKLNRIKSVENILGDTVTYQYNANGDIEQITDQEDRVTTYIYDELNRPVEVIDAQGQSTTTSYDVLQTDGSFATEITDPLGSITRSVFDEIYREIRLEENLGTANADLIYTTTFQYDNKENITGVTDANGGQTTYVYDELDRVTQITNADGGISSYTYDAIGNLLTFKDANNNSNGSNNTTTTYAYDGLNRLLQETDASGQNTFYQYDLVGNLIGMEDRNNNITRFEYDSANRQTKRMDPYGNEFKTEYDLFGNVIKETDELGRVIEYAYDPLNRLESATNPSNKQVTYSYDGVGNLIGMENELGQITGYEYDGINRQTKITNALGFSTTIEYANDTNTNQIVITETDAEGRIAKTHGDSRGRLIKTVNADNTSVEYTYDGNDNLLSVLDELGRTTTYSYDSLNRQTSVTTPEGYTTRTQYYRSGSASIPKEILAIVTPESDETDGSVGSGGTNGSVRTNATNGSIVTIADHLGNTRIHTYDERNLLVTEYDALNRTTTYTYDPEENLETVQDYLGNVTRYTYDSLNRLHLETAEGIRTRTYSYDRVGNLIQLVDRNGRTREFEYDNLDRQIEERWLNGSNIVNTIAYSYDDAHRLIGVNDGVARYTYQYDPAGRRTRESLNANGFISPVVLDYTYDRVGNLLSIMDTVAGVQLGVENYTYDNRNRLVEIAQSGNGVTSKTAVFSYDSASQLVGYDVSQIDDFGEFQQVFSTAQTFDLDGRLTNKSHTTAAGETLAYDYTFDEINRITQIASFHGETTFEYDSTNQLTSATSSFQEDESYTFDDTGNRTGEDIGPHNQLVNDGVYSYLYDNEGNRIQRTDRATGETTDYQWDYRNRLIQVQKSNADGEILSTANYQYDAFDHRLAKLVDEDGDGAFELIEGFVYKGSRQFELIEGLVYNGDAIHLVLTPTEIGQRYLYGPGVDLVLAEETVGEGVEFALTNHLNSVEFILDRDGQRINTIIYDSFGNVTSETNPDVDVRYGFTGRDLDEETGLDYYRARYYDPVVGRFLSEDPLGFVGGNPNLYGYVNNSPVNATDPSGLIPLPQSIKRD